MKIYAVDKRGNREEIDDLYWFEENGVHNFREGSTYEGYTFEFEIEDGDKITPKGE